MNEVEKTLNGALTLFLDRASGYRTDAGQFAQAWAAVASGILISDSVSRLTTLINKLADEANQDRR